MPTTASSTQYPELFADHVRTFLSDEGLLGTGDM